MQVGLQGSMSGHAGRRRDGGLCSTAGNFKRHSLLVSYRLCTSVLKALQCYLLVVVILLTVVVWLALCGSSKVFNKQALDAPANRNQPTNTNIVTRLTQPGLTQQRAREEAVQKVIGENVNPDDARVLQYLREYEIYPPSSHPVYKLSHHSMIQSSQATVINEHFNQQTGLYFIECGALDGERSSNTLWLEMERGWKGVLVEMDPFFFQQLLGKNRRAHSLNICLSPKPYPIQMQFSESNGGLGSLKDIEAKKGTLQTNCFPFLSVMLALNVTKVDYFSLDVEGTEMDILKTIPFDKIDIRTMSIEYNHVPGGEEGLKAFMNEKGYSVFEKIDVSLPEKDFFAQDLLFSKDS